MKEFVPVKSKFAGGYNFTSIANGFLKCGKLLKAHEFRCLCVINYYRKGRNNSDPNAKIKVIKRELAADTGVSLDISTRNRMALVQKQVINIVEDAKDFFCCIINYGILGSVDDAEDPINTTLPTASSTLPTASSTLPTASSTLPTASSTLPFPMETKHDVEDVEDVEDGGASPPSGIPIDFDTPPVSESQKETQMDKKFNPSINYLAQNTAKSEIRNKLIAKLKLASSIVKKYSLRIKPEELLQEINYKGKLVPRWVEVINQESTYPIQSDIECQEIAEKLIDGWTTIGLNHTPTADRLVGLIRGVLRNNSDFENDIIILMTKINSNHWLKNQQETFFRLEWLLQHNKNHNAYNYQRIISGKLDQFTRSVGANSCIAPATPKIVKILDLDNIVIG